MRLYGVRGWGSAIAEGMLVLAGIPYAFVDVAGFDRPGPARDLLTAVNPLAQVPALQLDDGSVLTETAAIALHLADLAPESGLVPPPGDPLRPRFLRLLVWLVANVYPTFTYGDYPQRWAPSAPGELLASTDAWRAMLYAWLEAEVAGPFVLGERCCALDIYLGTLVRWRPGEAWFAAHVPMLAAIGARVRAMPVLAGVMAANASSPDAG